MTDPRLEDHVVGLELQLVELVEQRERALVQGEGAEASAISDEITAIQTELTDAAEVVASDEPAPQPVVNAPPAEDAAAA
jgi:DNA-binding protein H-NS